MNIQSVDLANLNIDGASNASEEYRAPTPHFPSAIDNTMRESFVNCPTKFYEAHILGLAPKQPSIHLHAGAAFAKGLEVARRAFYELHYDEMDAVTLGTKAMVEAYGDFDEEYGFLDHNKSKANLLRAIHSYFIEYPLGVDTIIPLKTGDNRYALEFSFSVATKILHPVTGDPILYAGKFDMLGVRDGTLWVTDEKTTSSLGASWNKQWDLNSQFTGYCMGAREYGYPVAGAIIRGVGLLKTNITHAQCIIHRPDWQIARWWDQLHQDLNRMVACWKLDQWDHALGAACSAYGDCTFKPLCVSQEPDKWREMYFIERRWNPLDARD